MPSTSGSITTIPTFGCGAGALLNTPRAALATASSNPSSGGGGGAGAVATGAGCVAAAAGAGAAATGGGAAAGASLTRLPLGAQPCSSARSALTLSAIRERLMALLPQVGAFFFIQGVSNLYALGERCALCVLCVARRCRGGRGGGQRVRRHGGFCARLCGVQSLQTQPRCGREIALWVLGQKRAVVLGRLAVTDRAPGLHVRHAGVGGERHRRRCRERRMKIEITLDRFLGPRPLLAARAAADAGDDIL